MWLDFKSLGTHRISSQSTDSNDTFKQIKSWLELCKNHKCCTARSALHRQSTDIRPTRLLKLDHGKNHPNVRLVYTAQTGSENVQYATLSHCWGRTLFAKLTRSLIEDYRSHIPWETLSLTFQHAVMACLRLDIQYLWIDALCIVQDDGDDWLYEAGRMVGVYSNSYVNISADASSSGSDGLFRQRNPIPLQSFAVPHRNHETDVPTCIFYTNRWQRSVYEGPLARRAWTVQEKFLAPRGIHFAQEEVLWDCMELLSAESLPNTFDMDCDWPAIKKASLTLETTPEERSEILYDFWYRLISVYSEAALTFSSDRPIAIAGLAYSFCHSLGLSETNYLCGLWRPRLIHDMMWMANRDWMVPPQHSRVSNVPTWSWLSVCRGVFQQTHFDCYIAAEIIHASTKPLGDPFGSVLSGTIQLRTHLCAVSFRAEQCNCHYREQEVHHNIYLGDSILHEDEHFTFCADDSTEDGMRQMLNIPLYLMLGRSTIDEESEYIHESAGGSKVQLP